MITCSICTDPSRDQSTILVLEDSHDVAAMENIKMPRTLPCFLRFDFPMNGVAQMTSAPKSHDSPHG